MKMLIGFILGLIALKFVFGVFGGLVGILFVLLFLSLFIASIALRTGRTNIQLGVVHAVLLGTYLFLSFIP